MSKSTNRECSHVCCGSPVAEFVQMSEFANDAADTASNCTHSERSVRQRVEVALAGACQEEEKGSGEKGTATRVGSVAHAPAPALNPVPLQVIPSGELLDRKPLEKWNRRDAPASHPRAFSDAETSVKLVNYLCDCYSASKYEEHLDARAQLHGSSAERGTVPAETSVGGRSQCVRLSWQAESARSWPSGWATLTMTSWRRQPTCTRSLLVRCWTR
eukprot:3245391-Prymnesium_polylepis.1